MAYIKITVPSNNQLGFLLPGDVVYFEKKKTTHLLIGDVILVEERKELSMRKTIYISERFVLAEGQSKDDIRKKILPKHIVGKAEFLKRDGQKVRFESFYQYRTLLYFQEIIKVKNELTKNAINFLFLKGIPIHLYYEGTYPKRVFRDCDILIHAADYQKAKKLLNKLGYSSVQLAISKKIKLKEENFSKIVAGTNIIFDLHREIAFTTPIYNIDLFYPESQIKTLTSVFLNEKIYFELYGEKFPALSAENFLIYSTLHLFNHNYTGTFRYELIKNILLRKTIDYPFVLSRIKEFNLENFMFPLVLFFKKYYNLSLPQSFTNTLRPKKGIVCFIKKAVLKNGIFDEYDIGHNNKIRMQYHFYLSPAPFYKKIIIFFMLPILKMIKEN